MKLTPDDPRLTALALNELPQEEARSLRVEVEASAELQEAFQETASLASLLGDSFAESPLTLGEERRENIFRSGKRPDGEVLVMENRKNTRRHTFKVLAGAAAILTVGFVLLNRTQTLAPAVTDLSPGEGGEATVAGSTPVDFVDQTLPASELKVVNQLTLVTLPLQKAVLDSSSARSWLYAEKKALPSGLNATLPWVNSVKLTNEPQLEFDDLGISSELGECPWDMDKKLLLISISSLRAEGEAPHSLKGGLELEPSRVASAKLLSEGNDEISQDMVKLPAGESRLLLYELELQPVKSRPGAIHLETILKSSDAQSAYLPIPEAPLASPSREFKIVTLMARFARWHQTDSPLEDLQNFAKEADRLYVENEDTQTREALDLILLAKDLIIH